jgi:hypothetical protein
VDISAALKLNETFFNAQPLQDNSLIEVMVDGSTITITNHLMAGRATLQVVPGTGLVKDGDLTAIAPFIVSAKDNVGGVLMRKRFTSRGSMVRLYYGVSWANFPHDVDAGNAVPTYTMTMLYSGWIEGLMSAATAAKTVWAVGNKYGIKGNFIPFNITGIGDISIADNPNEFGHTNMDISAADNDAIADANDDAYNKNASLDMVAGLPTAGVGGSAVGSKQVTDVEYGG